MTHALEIFPCHMKLAHGVNGRVIGVEIRMLVTADHVKELPEPYRKIAEGMLYEAASKED